MPDLVYVLCTVLWGVDELYVCRIGRVLYHMFHQFLSSSDEVLNPALTHFNTLYRFMFSHAVSFFRFPFTFNFVSPLVGFPCKHKHCLNFIFGSWVSIPNTVQYTHLSLHSCVQVKIWRKSILLIYGRKEILVLRGAEGKGRERKGREGKRAEGKGKEGKGREGKGREGGMLQCVMNNLEIAFECMNTWIH